MISADRNLLFGILALQMDFVSRDALITAMNAWVLHKNHALGDILVQQRAMPDDERRVLESLVEKHLARHGGDRQRSLLAIPTEPAVRKALESVEDFELQASLVSLGNAGARPDQPLDNFEKTSDVGETTAPGVEGSGYLYELGAFQTAYRDLAGTLGATPRDLRPPELETCLETLKQSIKRGFANAAKLLQDPRLKRLRDERRSEFELLVSGAAANASIPSAAEPKTP
jgi:hypothetical protein